MRDDDFAPSRARRRKAGSTGRRSKQALASDPARSAWVSANAGSGKTHVLTQRVIRLLLSGCRPSAILCLTYTKAAASEMSNRVFERLAEWVTLDDEALDDRIAAIEGERPDLPEAPGSAAPVCPGAGNAGRAEDPDDPRLLRSAAAPVSARSQCCRSFLGARRPCFRDAACRCPPRAPDGHGKRGGSRTCGCLCDRSRSRRRYGARKAADGNRRQPHRHSGISRASRPQGRYRSGTSIGARSRARRNLGDGDRRDSGPCQVSTVRHWSAILGIALATRRRKGHRIRRRSARRRQAAEPLQALSTCCEDLFYTQKRQDRRRIRPSSPKPMRDKAPDLGALVARRPRSYRRLPRTVSTWCHVRATQCGAHRLPTG